jgi:hypothetical protein
MIEKELEERLSIYRMMCAAFRCERIPEPEGVAVKVSIPNQMVMVKKVDSPHPKFHRVWGERIGGEARCGVVELEGYDVYLQLRHAVKFADPCKSKKCFGD